MLIGLCFHTVLFNRGWLPRIFVLWYHFMLFQKTMRAIIEVRLLPVSYTHLTLPTTSRV